MDETRNSDSPLKETLRVADYGVVYLENDNSIKYVPFETDNILGELKAGLSDFCLSLATYVRPLWQLPFKARISWEERMYDDKKVFDIRTALKSKNTTTEELYQMLSGPIRDICVLKGYKKIYTTTRLNREHMTSLGWHSYWAKSVLRQHRYYIDLDSIEKNI